jgi:hypothetical protein
VAQCQQPAGHAALPCTAAEHKLWCANTAHLRRCSRRRRKTARAQCRARACSRSPAKQGRVCVCVCLPGQQQPALSHVICCASVHPCQASRAQHNSTITVQVRDTLLQAPRHAHNPQLPVRRAEQGHAGVRRAVLTVCRVGRGACDEQHSRRRPSTHTPCQCWVAQQAAGPHTRTHTHARTHRHTHTRTHTHTHIPAARHAPAPSAE